METIWSTFRILTGRPTGKRPLGRPRRRWKGSIRMDQAQQPIEFRAYQPTADLTPTCPQTEVNDNPTSLGVMCGEHVESLNCT